MALFDKYAFPSGPPRRRSRGGAHRPRSAPQLPNNFTDVFDPLLHGVSQHMPGDLFDDLHLTGGWSASPLDFSTATSLANVNLTPPVSLTPSTFLGDVSGSLVPQQTFQTHVSRTIPPAAVSDTASHDTWQALFGPQVQHHPSGAHRGHLNPPVAPQNWYSNGSQFPNSYTQLSADGQNLAAFPDLLPPSDLPSFGFGDNGANNWDYVDLQNLEQDDGVLELLRQASSSGSSSDSWTHIANEKNTPESFEIISSLPSREISPTIGYAAPNPAPAPVSSRAVTSISYEGTLGTFDFAFGVSHPTSRNSTGSEIVMPATSHVRALDSFDFDFNASLPFGCSSADLNPVCAAPSHETTWDILGLEFNDVNEIDISGACPNIVITDVDNSPGNSLGYLDCQESRQPARPAQPTSRDWRLDYSSDSAEPGNVRKRKKGKPTEAARTKTKQVRRMGACIRCRMYKVECDQDNPCRRCSELAVTHRLFFQPCSREDLKDISLVRHANGKFGQSRVAFRKYLWTSKNLGYKTIEVRWTLPGNVPVEIPPIKVRCREFSPRENDIVEEEWQVNGRPITVRLPPFACAEDHELSGIIHEMVEGSRTAVEQRMLQNINDELTRLTFEEAYRFSRKYKSEMVRLALRIRSTAIFCQGWGCIVGPETLGTPKVDHAAEGYCGSLPISPALCHQKDVTFINMMTEDEKKLKKELRKAIFQRDPKPWYEIFLAYFVIVSHLKYIHGEAVGFMRAREKTGSGNQVSYHVKTMVEEWDHSASNMLYHFRYVLRGFLPFEEAKKGVDFVRKQAKLDEDAAIYMHKAVHLLQEQEMKGNIRDLVGNTGERKNPEPDDRWIKQLFRDQMIDPSNG